MLRNVLESQLSKNSITWKKHLMICFRTHYRECTYQNFSANTDGYQQVSLSVTPEKTNEIVNYIAFVFVYGYNENEMTVDNAEVNLLKVKLNQSCGKAKM